MAAWYVRAEVEQRDARGVYGPDAIREAVPGGAYFSQSSLYATIGHRVSPALALHATLPLVRTSVRGVAYDDDLSPLRKADGSEDPSRRASHGGVGDAKLGLLFTPPMWTFAEIRPALLFEVGLPTGDAAGHGQSHVGSAAAASDPRVEVTGRGSVSPSVALRLVRSLDPWIVSTGILGEVEVMTGHAPGGAIGWDARVVRMLGSSFDVQLGLGGVFVDDTHEGAFRRQHRASVAAEYFAGGSWGLRLQVAAMVPGLTRNARDDRIASLAYTRSF